MGMLPDTGYPQTGDIGEVGYYACMTCEDNGQNEPTSIYLEKKRKFPKCPKCVETYWFKV